MIESNMKQENNMNAPAEHAFNLEGITEDGIDLQSLAFGIAFRYKQRKRNDTFTELDSIAHHAAVVAYNKARERGYDKQHTIKYLAIRCHGDIKNYLSRVQGPLMPDSLAEEVQDSKEFFPYSLQDIIDEMKLDPMDQKILHAVLNNYEFKDAAPDVGLPVSTFMRRVRKLQVLLNARLGRTK